MATSCNLVWLRRDLRTHDHAALAEALDAEQAVQPVFVFDTAILAQFSDAEDRRLTFLAEALRHVHAQFKARSAGLLVVHGDARQAIPVLARALHAHALYAAEDFEPATRQRDAEVSMALEGHTACHFVLDHLLLHPDQVLKHDGSPYQVFTPYARRWRERLLAEHRAERTVADGGRYAAYAQACQAAREAGLTVLDPDASAEALLQCVGYRMSDSAFLPQDAPERLHTFVENDLNHYAVRRDLPGEDGTSRLSPYLRFGILSVREVAGGMGQDRGRDVR